MAKRSKRITHTKQLRVGETLTVARLPHGIRLKDAYRAGVALGHAYNEKGRELTESETVKLLDALDLLDGDMVVAGDVFLVDIDLAKSALD